MKIEKIAAVAEIISSIAIVLTLIYLAGQTRQMTDQTEQMAIQSEQMTDAILATSRQELMSGDITMIAALISNPEAWANVFDKPIAEMTTVEARQVRNIFAGMLRIREYAWFQYQNGILDEATLRSYLAPMPRWIGSENGTVLWEILGADLAPEFVVYVNAMIEQAEQ